MKKAYLQVVKIGDKYMLKDGQGNHFKIQANGDKKLVEKVRYCINKSRSMLVQLKEENGTEHITYGTAEMKFFDKNADLSKFPEFWLTKQKVEPPSEEVAIKEFLDKCYDLKPDALTIDKLKWKYLMRTVKRSKNIMLKGPAGCGKTKTAKAIGEAFPDRPFEIFNFGSTQDPRSTLIGNTHFNKEDGTFFSRSAFIKAITTDNCIIVLDEFTRAHPEAHNIVMSVLDYHQRYVRLDEADGAPKIFVKSGVCFIATANVGNEYTGTRVTDRAIEDRFTHIELNPMTQEEEESHLRKAFPYVGKNAVRAISQVAGDTRDEVKREDPKIQSIISTRLTEEMTGLVGDGFTFEEACEICVYPFYSSEGDDSERMFVKIMVQKYVPDDEPDENEAPHLEDENKEIDPQKKTTFDTKDLDSKLPF